MDYSSVSPVSAREFVPAAVPAKGTIAPAKPASANDEPFSFWDVLDLVNPLQHVPIVNTIYREATGDTIKTPMKIIGSTLIGGPIGFASAVADGLVEETTGKDMGAHAMSVFRGPAAPGEFVPDETQFADAREFIPDAALVADAREFIPAAVIGDTMVADAREFMPQPLTGEVSETDVADAREFIPRAVAAPVLMAAAEVPSEQDALAAGNDLLRMAALRQLSATRLAAVQPPLPETKLTAGLAASTGTPLARQPVMASAQPLAPQHVAAQQPPSETEAMIAAAQIAAKAHVRVPAVAAARPNAPQQLAAAPDARFMPIRAGAAQTRELAAPRTNAANANTAEVQALMARTKYAPGVRGNRDISPAVMAQATKPRAAQDAAAAALQYERARQAAAGNVPQDVPGWFDDAMLASIDKYNAMKNRSPGL